MTYRKSLSFPFKARKKISQVLLSQLEGEIPSSIDSVVADFVPLVSDGEASLGLAVACGRDVVQGVLEASGSPLAVQVDAMGLAAAALYGNPGNGTALCCTAGSVIGVRLSGGGLADLRRTLLVGREDEDATLIADLAVELHRDGPLLLACGGLLERTLAALLERGISKVQTAHDWRLFRESETPLEEHPDLYLPALGFALRALGRRESFTLDLRQGPFLPLSPVAGLWRPALRAGVLGAAALTLWTGALVSELASAKAEYRAYSDSIRSSFTSLFPDVRVVSEVAQIQERIAQLERRAADIAGFEGASALSAMAELSRAVPEDADLKIDELSYDTGKLRVEGSVPSFDTVDRVKLALEQAGGFSNVSVQNARVGADAARVNFRLQLEVK